jgi:ATP-dependent Clp protease ATP-binding subunit ClpC
VHNYPFERLTTDAQLTLQLAQEEAERSRRSYIGTEHILLGLLRLERGTAHRSLTELGVTLGSVREMIEATLGPGGPKGPKQIIPTSLVKRVIEIAFEESRRMGRDSVHSGHLLSGLAIEGEGIASHVLKDLGASKERVVAVVERNVGFGPGQIG